MNAADALPLVQYLSRKYRGTPLGREDAFGIGSVAAVEAAARYDASRGVPFNEYAASRIRGAMSDAARYTYRSRTIAVTEAVTSPDHRSFDKPVHDHYFTAGRIVERLAGLSQPDRHVACLVAAGYRTGEIAAAWGVDKSRISQRLRRIRTHLAEVTA